MEESKRYYLFDIESGMPYEVTKEQYEEYHAAIRNLHSCFSIKNPCIGKVQIFGTGGEIEKGNFEEFWKKEEELCKNSMTYFASNYLLIDGKDPKWTDVQLKEIEIYEKLKKEGKSIKRLKRGRGL